MSFKIQWPSFGPEFIEKAIEQLTVALNSGKKPDNIAGKIVVTQLHMGTKPPNLEILEISELLNERFKGLFRLVYQGDAFIKIQTQVQANPLATPKQIAPFSLNVARGMLLAHKPFIVPMEMKLSKVHLRGVVVLVVDKEKGVTLVFRSDPLEKVHVSSTFDNIPNIQKLLQRQIEEQLRNMFQEELPQMIHNLSLLMLQQKKGDSSGDNSHSSIPESVDSGRGLDPRKVYERDNQRIPHHKKWANNDPVYSNTDLFDLEGGGIMAEGFVLYKTLSGGDVNDREDKGLQRIADFGVNEYASSVTGAKGKCLEKTEETYRAQTDAGVYERDCGPGYYQVGLQGAASKHASRYRPGASTGGSLFLDQIELRALDGERDFTRFYSPRVQAFLEKQKQQEYCDLHEIDNFGELTSRVGMTDKDTEVEVDDSISNVGARRNISWNRPPLYHRTNDHGRINHPTASDRVTPKPTLSNASPTGPLSPISPPCSIHKGQILDVQWQRPSVEKTLTAEGGSYPLRRTSNGSMANFSNHIHHNISLNSSYADIGDAENMVNGIRIDTESTLAHLSGNLIGPRSFNRKRPEMTGGSSFIGDDNNDQQIEAPSHVVLSPSDNHVTAHLANLMTTYLTISPNTQGMSHLTFRGAVSEVGYSENGYTREESIVSSASTSFGIRAARNTKGGKRHKLRRRMHHTIFVPSVLLRQSDSSSGS